MFKARVPHSTDVCNVCSMWKTCMFFGTWIDGSQVFLSLLGQLVACTKFFSIPLDPFACFISDDGAYSLPPSPDMCQLYQFILTLSGKYKMNTEYFFNGKYALIRCMKIFR